MNKKKNTERYVEETTTTKNPLLSC